MMKTITVYRLQHKKSLLGPFEHRLVNGGYSKLALKVISHKDPNDFPEFAIWRKKMGFDPGVTMPEEWVFGWDSVDKLRQFTREGTQIGRYGFELVWYETDNYLRLPDGQVVFRRG